MSQNPTKPVIDWELIERDYRAGLLSVREIAASQGITHGAINKRAKRDGWERDLKAKIQAKAEALVSRREVSSLVSAEQVATDKGIIEANAERIATVRMEHRRDIQRSRTLAISLLEEMEQQTNNLPLYQEIGELLRSEDKNGQDRLNDLYHKVISSSGRIGSMKQLAETLRVLVALEREAYGIAGIPPSGEGDENNAPVIYLPDNGRQA